MKNLNLKQNVAIHKLFSAFYNTSEFFCFLLIFFTILYNIHAQETEKACKYNLEGTILDVDTKNPLPFVKIAVKGTKRFTFTDIDGAFYIKDLCNEYSTLIISCFGYCDAVCEDYHQHGKSPHIFLKQKVENLRGITINAKRHTKVGTVSVAQQILDKEALLSNPTQTLASALSQVEGVTFASTGNNIQLPVIHGLYGNRILIVNNGLKHGFQNWGTDHAPEIDITSANTITVLKGAAGVRYGPEALGGAIVINGDPLYLNEPLKGKIGAGYQTNGMGSALTLEVGQGLENFSYHFGANYTKIGDKQTPNYILTNTGKEEKALNAGLRYQIKDLDFKLYYSYLKQNLGILFASYPESGAALQQAIQATKPLTINPFSYKINEPNQLVSHQLTKAEINWNYADDAKLTFRIGTQFNQRKEFDVRRNADLPVIDLDLVTNDYQLEWKHPDWFQLDGLLGVQMFTQDNDNNPSTETPSFIPNYNTLRYSAFIIESLKTKSNTFELGVRVDHENNNVRIKDNKNKVYKDWYSFTNITASLGYVRQVSENTNFRTNIGTAWRTPNMAELYGFGGHSFGLHYGLLRYNFTDEGIFNTNKVFLVSDGKANPEKGYKWINEWHHHHKSNTYVFTTYANYIENFVFKRPVTAIRRFSGIAPAFIEHQANVLFTGADFTWKKKWSKSIEGLLGGSYLWSRNIKDDEVLINQPPISVSYKLTFKPKNFWVFNTSELSVKPSYTFRQFQSPRVVSIADITAGTVNITSDAEIFDFKKAPSGYFLADLAWKFKINQFTANLSVENILNTRYRNYLNEMRYFADEPGRNFLFSINYIF